MLIFWSATLPSLAAANPSSVETSCDIVSTTGPEEVGTTASELTSDAGRRVPPRAWSADFRSGCGGPLLKLLEELCLPEKLWPLEKPPEKLCLENLARRREL